jgi:hypothetical protein
MNPLAPLLDSLSRTHGLGPLALDEAGVCVLRYDDRLDVIIKCPPGAESVLVQIPLMPVPGVDREGFFRKVLALNHRGEATRGATLSLNEISETVMLGALLPADTLDALGLEHLIGNLIDGAQSLIARLEPGGAHPDVSTDADETARSPAPNIQTSSFFDPRHRG